MTPTTQAVDNLRSRLQRIHTECMDTRPNQAVGEMIEVMLKMPEWAELARPQEVADAERYRWLRDANNWDEDGICPITANGEDTIYGEHLDKAIDAARRAAN